MNRNRVKQPRAKAYLAAGVAVCLGGLAIAGYLYLDSKQPRRFGEITLPGLREDVEVVFDAYAVPHLYARHQEDVYRALGYLHAQDRLFQMELLRRTAAGQLSEVLGADLVDTDRFFRTLRIGRFADEYVNTTLSSSDPLMLAALQAYLDGVNHFVRFGPTPLEYDLLGIPRREFTRGDVVRIGGLMAYDLAHGQRTDPLLTYIRDQLGEEYLNELAWSAKLEDGRFRIASHRTDRDATGAISLMRGHAGLHGRFSGSNSWVIAPDKTASGSVILANDPHMGYSAPSVWYEAHLVTPDFELYGHHLAGIPFALLGHNRERGWGLTMLKNDDVDFFREQTNPANPDQVWFRDHWEDLTIEDEVIRVKDGDDVGIRVRRSRHGPLVNDAIQGVSSTEGSPVSMWWSYHDLTNRILEGFFDLAHAGSLSEMREGVRKMHAPGLNVLYGDREGNIAWWTAARVPVRPPHVSGRFLLDGSTGADEFEGFLPFTENPQRVNPPEGFLVSANNRPPPGAGAEVAGYYNIDDRARHITALLVDGSSFTSEDMRLMMLDSYAPVVGRVKQAVLPILEKSATIRARGGNAVEALRYLRDWEGTHGTDDIAPSVYHEFLSQVLVGTFEDELGPVLFQDFLRTKMMDWTTPVMLGRPTARWWDDIGTDDRRESREDILVGAWLAAITTLESSLGANPADWQWGHLHVLEHNHALGRQKPLDRIFNVGPFPVAGSREVINQQLFLYATGLKRVNAGPSTRRIVDFSRPERALGINPTGQSGYPFDRHYDDQAELFYTGQLRSQLMNREEILDERRRVLRLRPSS